MDWKSAINKRFDGAAGVQKWLDANHPDWREQEPDIVAEYVAKEAMGYDAWGRTSVDVARDIEAYIMEYYVGA
jgi:hypothetical protein